jgi:hypothetical protein
MENVLVMGEVRSHRALNARERALFLCLMAAGVSAAGFAFPLVSTLVSISFAAVLILWANPIGLPALAILWTQSVSFGGAAYNADTEFNNAVQVGGFPLTLQLFTLGAMTGRALLEWISHPNVFRHRPWVKRTMTLWAVFFLITLLSAAWGRTSGFTNWTQPIRASMALGCAFYGMILAPKIEKMPWVGQWLLRIGIGVLALAAVGLYWNHVVFFYLTLGACAFWYALRERRWFLVAGSLLSPLVALGAALTFMGSVILGLVAGHGWFSTRRRRDKPSKWARVVIPAVILLGSLALVGAVLFTSYSPDIAVGDIPSGNLVQYFLFKLYLDRGVLWRAAWQAMVDRPELLSPAGRPLVVISPFFGLDDNLWMVHVHNSFLELPRETGIPGGILFLVLVIRFWQKLRHALAGATIPVVRVFAGTALISILVGSTTGMWPYDFFAGPWIWLWTGIAIGHSQPDNR